jgi:hypothetical protein
MDMIRLFRGVSYHSQIIGAIETLCFNYLNKTKSSNIKRIIRYFFLKINVILKIIIIKEYLNSKL